MSVQKHADVHVHREAKGYTSSQLFIVRRLLMKEYIVWKMKELGLNELGQF